MKAGPRQVWWCWILNEPFIVEFKGNDSHCPNCEQLNFEDCPKHEFVGPAYKTPPLKWAGEYLYDEKPLPRTRGELEEYLHDVVGRCFVKARPQWAMRGVHETSRASDGQTCDLLYRVIDTFPVSVVEEVYQEIFEEENEIPTA